MQVVTKKYSAPGHIPITDNGCCIRASANAGFRPSPGRSRAPFLTFPSFLIRTCSSSVVKPGPVNALLFPQPPPGGTRGWSIDAAGHLSGNGRSKQVECLSSGIGNAPSITCSDHVSRRVRLHGRHDRQVEIEPANHYPKIRTISRSYSPLQSHHGAYGIRCPSTADGPASQRSSLKNKVMSTGDSAAKDFRPPLLGFTITEACDANEVIGCCDNMEMKIRAASKTKLNLVR